LFSNHHVVLIFPRLWAGRGNRPGGSLNKVDSVSSPHPPAAECSNPEDMLHYDARIHVHRRTVTWLVDVASQHSQHRLPKHVAPTTLSGATAQSCRDSQPVHHSQSTRPRPHNPDTDNDPPLVLDAVIRAHHLATNPPIISAARRASTSRT